MADVKTPWLWIPGKCLAYPVYIKYPYRKIGMVNLKTINFGARDVAENKTRTRTGSFGRENLHQLLWLNELSLSRWRMPSWLKSLLLPVLITSASLALKFHCLPLIQRSNEPLQYYELTHIGATSVVCWYLPLRVLAGTVMMRTWRHLRIPLLQGDWRHIWHCTWIWSSICTCHTEM